MDAIIILAFDIPPIAHPPVGLIADENIRLQDGTWPTLDIGIMPRCIIGVTSSGWLMINGVGWRRFQGDVSAIAAACNAMQLRLLTDRSAYLSAVEKYQQRSRRCAIGGLPEIDKGGGRCAIRVGDITATDVKEAFLETIRSDGLGLTVDPDETDTFAAAGSDHVDANVWWRFAWRWKTSTQP